MSSPEGEKIPPSLLAWLAEYQLNKKEFEKAIETAGLLSGKSAGDSWKQTGYCIAGHALAEQGKKAEARAELEKGAAIQGNFESRPEAMWRLGELLFEAGVLQRARECLEEAAGLASEEKLFPIRMRSYVGIARVLKAEGKHEDAAKYFMSVAVLYDDPAFVPECLYEAGRMFKQLGKPEESAKTLKELAERYPGSEWAKKE